MTRVIYKGAFQARSIKDIKTGKVVFDGNLVPDRVYNLPDDHPEIKTLIGLGLLVVSVDTPSPDALAAPVPEAVAVPNANSKKKEAK